MSTAGIPFVITNHCNTDSFSCYFSFSNATGSDSSYQAAPNSTSPSSPTILVFPINPPSSGTLTLICTNNFAFFQFTTNWTYTDGAFSYVPESLTYNTSMTSQQINMKVVIEDNILYMAILPTNSNAC